MHHINIFAKVYQIEEFSRVNMQIDKKERVNDYLIHKIQGSQNYRPLI